MRLSWQIVTDHPWFGDQLALLKMQELRQGEGIIDLMNGFMEILLSNGFFGLSLFLLFIVIGSFKAFRVSAGDREERSGSEQTWRLLSGVHTRIFGDDVGRWIN